MWIFNVNIPVLPQHSGNMPARMAGISGIFSERSASIKFCVEIDIMPDICQTSEKEFWEHWYYWTTQFENIVKCRFIIVEVCIDDSMQDCSNSIANALETLQSLALSLQYTPHLKMKCVCGGGLYWIQGGGGGGGYTGGGGGGGGGGGAILDSVHHLAVPEHSRVFHNWILLDSLETWLQLTLSQDWVR